MSDYYPKCAPDVNCPHCNPRSNANEQSSLAPVPCYVEWEPEANKPAIFFSVLVYGVLDGESEPDTHEGYWCGASWWSVRSDEDDGDWMKLSNVTHWARRPTPHNEKLTDSRRE